MDLVSLWPLAGYPLAISLPLAVVGVLSLVVAVNVLNQAIYRALYPYRAPLVPYLFPWIGSAVQYGMAPYEFFERNRLRYGDQFAFVMCGRVMTVCLGPNGHDFVFNSKLADVSAEEAYKHLTTPVFGKGVIYDCPNSRLMEQKKFAKQALTRDAFRTYVPKIVGEVVAYLRSPAKLAGPGSTVNVLDVTPEITIYTASRTLMGDEMRAKFSRRTAELYSDLDKGFKPLNFVFPNLPLPYYRRRDIAHDEIQGQYLEVIRARRASEKPGEHNRDLIDSIMNSATYKDGVAMSDEEIANLCIGVLMGGQHTSATTSAWILLHLAQSTEYQEKLFDEQMRVTHGQPLQFDDLQEMPLLNAVIRETLRLHAPLHSIFRKVMRPLAIPGTKYTVPRGHYVMVSPGHTHQHNNWFKEASTWRPERWLDQTEAEKVSGVSSETVDYGFGAVTKGASSPFLPFGAGRHRCIGEQFAMMQLGTIISTFVRELRWTLPPGKTALPEIDFESMVVMPKNPADIVYTLRV